MKLYYRAFTLYTDFSGCANREEYWMFVLFHTLVSFAFAVLNSVLDESMGIALFAYMYAMVSFMPSLAITVRRLHDVGKDGYKLLVLLVPVFGAIYLLIQLVKPSQIKAQANQLNTHR